MVNDVVILWGQIQEGINLVDIVVVVVDGVLRWRKVHRWERHLLRLYELGSWPWHHLSKQMLPTSSSVELKFEMSSHIILLYSQLGLSLSSLKEVGT